MKMFRIIKLWSLPQFQSLWNLNSTACRNNVAESEHHRQQTPVIQNCQSPNPSFNVKNLNLLCPLSSNQYLHPTRHNKCTFPYGIWYGHCSWSGIFFIQAKFVVNLIKSLLESDVEPKQIGWWRICNDYSIMWGRFLNKPVKRTCFIYCRCHYTIQVTAYSHHKLLKCRRVSLLTLMSFYITNLFVNLRD